MKFADHLLRHVPLAARIKKVLNEHPAIALRACASSRNCKISCPTALQKRHSTPVINWGRYGEIFSYNDKSGNFQSGGRSSPERVWFQWCSEVGNPMRR